MGQSISDYTEQEFKSLVKRICVDDYDSEQEHIDAVFLFEKLSEHPDGSDLIFYPEKAEDSTPESITQIVKEWRAANGKSGFKMT